MSPDTCGSEGCRCSRRLGRGPDRPPFATQAPAGANTSPSDPTRSWSGDGIDDTDIAGRWQRQLAADAERRRLARDAPHVLGRTVAEHADRPGDFIQIVYFTSEQDARRLEQERSDEADEPAQGER